MTQEQKDKWDGEQVINRMMDQPNGLVYHTNQRRYYYRISRKLFRLDAAFPFLMAEYGFSRGEAFDVLLKLQRTL